MGLTDKTKLCGLIGLAMKAGKIVAGTDACLEDIRKRKVSLLLIACDSSDRTKIAFNQKAEEYQIAIYEVLSIEEMSKAIGKVNKAVIGIKDVGFSKKIKNIINGGEMIG